MVRIEKQEEKPRRDKQKTKNKTADSKPTDLYS